MLQTKTHIHILLLHRLWSIHILRISNFRIECDRLNIIDIMLKYCPLCLCVCVCVCVCAKVSGLRQVTNSVKSRRARLVLLAVDTEESETLDGMQVSRCDPSPDAHASDKS